MVQRPFPGCNYVKNSGSYLTDYCILVLYPSYLITSSHPMADIQLPMAGFQGALHLHTYIQDSKNS